MPSRFVRFCISIAVVLQLAIVGASLASHRGNSRIAEDFLSFFDIYRTFGNWRIESNAIAIASSSELSESVWIEWHVLGSDDKDWIAWPDQNLKPTRGFNSLRQLRWLRQLADLQSLGITEGVSQMITTATNTRSELSNRKIDKVRVMISPAVSMDRFLEIESVETMEDLPEELQPRSVYQASVIEIGEGKRSLLPKIENRRLSPAVKNSKSIQSRAPASSPGPSLQIDAEAKQ